MVKKILFIVMLMMVSIFLFFDRQIAAEIDTSAQTLVDGYFNNGIYTKKTQMFLTEETIQQFKDHFHVNATSNRTTYYSGDYLLMGDYDGGFDEVNSGYMNDGNNMAHFEYSGNINTPISNKYISVKGTSIQEYYVLLDDMMVSGYFDKFIYSGNNKYTYTVSYSESIDGKLHDFLWFSAPGLEESIFGNGNTPNYFSQEGIKLVLEEKSHEYYGSYLSIRIILDILDAGKVRTPEEIAEWEFDEDLGCFALPEGEELVLSEARVYKGLKAFNEDDYLDFSYTVNWVDEDGSVLEKDTVKYGELPTYDGKEPTKEGYIFAGWDKEVVNVTGAATYTTTWTPNTNTKYVVKHYQMDVFGNYPTTPTETENKTGTTGTTVTPAVKTYTGFTSPATQTVTIAADGSTVVEYRYTRNKYYFDVNHILGANEVIGNPENAIPTIEGIGSYKIYINDVEVDHDSDGDYFKKNYYGSTIKIVIGEAGIGYSYNGIRFDTPQAGTTNTNVDSSVTTYIITMDETTIANLYTTDPTVNPVTRITIKWVRNEYTISYDLAGGSVATANPTSYTVISDDITLNNPTKTGYTFTGWTGSNGSTPSTSVSVSKGSTGNKSYTANWTAIKYKVTFNGNGHTGGSTADQSGFTYDVPASLRANGFTRTGYTFVGWNTQSDGSGITYADRESVKNLTSVSGGTVTLYAKWTANTYTIVFNANGGSGTMNSITATYDQYAQLPANVFTKEGYTFKGWATNDEANLVVYQDKASITMGDGRIDLYAVWEINKYTVKYVYRNANGVSTTKEVKLDYNTAASTVTNNAPTTPTAYTVDKVYTFSKWDKTFATVTGDVTYTAQYSESVRQYTVTWNVNGGKFSDNTTASKTTSVNYNASPSSGAPTGLTKAQTEQYSYTFKGWATSANGSVVDLSTQKITKNTTYFAIYTKTIRSYTITFNPTGGTFKNGTTVDYVVEKNYGTTNSEIGVPGNMTKTGYTFAGWGTELSGGTVYKPTDIPSVTSDVTYYAQWTVNEYTYNIEYKSSSGKSLGSTTVTGTFGTITTVTAPAKTGYTTPSSQTVVFDSANAKTITFTYEIINYTISYTLNDGSVTGNPTSYNVESAAITLKNPSKTGYTFTGWTGANGTTAQTSVTIASGSTGNKSYTANFTINKYTITFNPTGGTFKNGTTVDYVVEKNYGTPNSEIGVPGNMTKTGYTFVGWGTELSGGTIYEPTSVPAVTGDITYYAQWKGISYSVKFNANGGTGTMDTQTGFIYGTKTALQINKFTKEGYTFLGWSKDKDATTATYTDGQKVSNLTTVDSKVVTIYAIWKVNSYTITFNPNGGTFKNGSTTDFIQVRDYGTPNSEIGVPGNMTKTGYIFIGWGTKLEGGTIYEPTSVPSVTGDATYYAQWAPSTYNIKFAANGGTGSMSMINNVVDGNSVTLTANKFTRSGYTFAGWNTKADGTGVSYADGGTVKNLVPNKDGIATLYAMWQYIVIYNPNGGALASGSATVTSNNLIPQFTSTAGKTSFYHNGITYVDNGDGTLTIKGTAATGNPSYFNIWGRTNDITFPAGTYYMSGVPGVNGTYFSDYDGNYIDSGKGCEFTLSANTKISFRLTVEGVTLNNVLYTPTIIKFSRHIDGVASNLDAFGFRKTGYSFAGWNTKPDGSGITYEDNESITNLKPNSDGTVTLYALWKVNDYTIQFMPNGADGKMEKLAMTYEVAKNLPKNTFTWENHTFRGWNTKADGSGTAYYDGESVKNVGGSGTVRLYAQWADDNWLVNDLYDVGIPDTHIYVEDGVYYIYGTCSKNPNEIDCYTTTDFKVFTRHYGIFVYDGNGWEHNETPSFFAVEVYKINGKYYLYYSANDKNLKRYMSVLVGDSPLGPFKRINGSTEPVFKNLGGGLDAHILLDGSDMYMYYASVSSLPGISETIWGVKMKSPYEVDITTAKELVRPGYLDSTFKESENVLEWERYRSSLYNGYKSIVEGPFMIKNNGKYYLTYSVNGTWEKHYNVCYAVSDSPLGNFVKPYTKGQIWTNLLLGYPGDTDMDSELHDQWNGFSSGNAHHSFFYAGDELMIAYQSHAKREPQYNEITLMPKYQVRFLAFDYVYFDKDGNPFINGPTNSKIPMPSIITGYSNIAPYASVSGSNVTSIGNVNDRYNVDCYNLIQEAGKEVILGKGKSTITFKLDGIYEINALAIYNSAYYEKYIDIISSIDFGNGHVLSNVAFDKASYVNDTKKFIFPNSAFTVDINGNIRTNKITITFNLPNGGQINDIAIMGKKVDSIHRFGDWLEITGGSKRECVDCGKVEYKADNGLTPVVVSHRNLDGSLIKETITGVDYNEIYTVYALDNSLTPSHDFVRGYVDSSVEFVDIYYSNISKWDGKTVSTKLSGSGTEADPYLIKSAADLAYVKNNAASFSGKYLKMMVSVDVSASPNFMISGFKGHFDGNNCSIRGLNINNTTAAQVGLFDIVTSGNSISNLNVYGSVNGNSKVAGVVGYASCEIVNCTNYVTVSGTGKYVGGVAGNVTTNSTGIIDCTNYGNVTSTSADGYVGGIVGSISAIVEGCSNYGNIVGTKYVGGVIGALYSSVNNCHNYGVITGETRVAGVVGYAAGTISNCYNYGIINADSYIGGVSGYCKDGAAISNSYNYGTINGNKFYIGGIVGCSAYTISNCENNGLIYGNDQVGGIVGYGTGSINGCVNNGNIEIKSSDSSQSTQVGGIVGQLVGSVSNSENYGAINGDNLHQVGGIVGTNGSSAMTVVNCQNYGNITATNQIGGIVGLINDTSSKIENSNNYGYIYSSGDKVYGVTSKTEYTSGCLDFGYVTQNMPLKLWYDEEAPKIKEGNGHGYMSSHGDQSINDDGWTNWSLPIGNGYFGVNTFGRTYTERLQITDKTLSNPWQIRANGSYPEVGGLNNFSETYIDFKHTNSKVSNYERYLDLNKAISGVSYDYNGVTYTREYFTSYPDKAFVIYLDASVDGGLSFTLRPTVPFEQEYAYIEGDGLSKEGEVKSRVENGVGVIELTGILNYYGIDFMALYHVYIEGGSMKASTVSSVTAENADGTSHSKVGDGTIEVKGATKAYIVVTLGTDYEIESESFFGGQYSKDKPSSGRNLEYVRNKVEGYMTNIESLTKYLPNIELQYQLLKERHLADYKELFDRVDVSVEFDVADLAVTTDILQQRASEGNISKYLENLIFQHGRYLLIASSRPGTLPAHLQGAWNCYDMPPWSSGYWHNINVQMNYWPAFNTNLAETFEAYVGYNQSYMAYAEQLADKLVNQYNPDMSGQDGGNGWTIGVAGNPFFFNGDRSPGNMGFTTQLFWDYYAYTKDPEVLEVVYKVLANAARFITKSVKQDENGNYLVEYCDSPEQYVNGKWYYTTGTTYAQTLSYLNNYHVLLAAKDLGIDIENQVFLNDEEYSILKTILTQLDKYDPINVGLSGQIKEFREEEYYGDYGDPAHRHISQLVGLYPGNLINSSTPAWMDAALESLKGRSEFSQAYGWVYSHKMSLYARLKDGDSAYSEYQKLLNGVIAPNLWTKYNEIYQAESNFGATAGMAEMLLQSHEGYIEVLPAIPSAWAKGSYKGLVAEGNFEVGCIWEDSLAKQISITSKLGGEVKVKYPSITKAKVVDSKGKSVSYSVVGDNLISFNTVKGETYYLTGFVKQVLPKQVTNLKYNREGLGAFTLTWDASSDAVSYNVYKAVGNAATYTLIGNTKSTSFTYTPSEADTNTRTTFVVTAVDSNGRESKRTLCYFNPINLYADINCGQWYVGNDGDYEVVVDALDIAETYYLYEKKADSSKYVLVSQSNTNVLTYNLYDPNATYAVRTKSIYGYESELFVLEDYNLLEDSDLEATGSVFNSSFGFDKLNDGVFGESAGRYSSKVDTSSNLDATFDLGGIHTLNEIRLYDYTNTNYADCNYAGNSLIIEVYKNGVWTSVVNCKTNAEILKYRSSSADTTGYKYLSFRLDGITAEAVRIYVKGAVSGKSISYHEMKCLGYKGGLLANIFDGVEFIPTDKAESDVISWTNSPYFGYENLTDGLFKETDGRFSTKTATTSVMDATLNLGGCYALNEIRLYDYTEDNYATASFAGANLVIQVYRNGKWITVYNCYSNALIAKYRVSKVDKTGFKYLSFDMGNIIAEKVRIYINGTTGKSISFYEINCYGEFVGELENVFSGKSLSTTNSEAYNSNFSFDKLIDSTATNDVGGRYSSKTVATSVLDATIDLGSYYTLNELKMYVFSDSNGTVADYIGNSLLIEAYNNGVWTKLFELTTNAEVLAHLVSKADSTGKQYLLFDLDGVTAQKLRIYINGVNRSISYYEFKCFGYEANVFSDLDFIPTAAAKANVISWTGSPYFGYENLTDGVFGESTGRFSTKSSADSVMDATINLGGLYSLNEIRLYDYTNDSYATAAFAGANLTIQVYKYGVWNTVISCDSNASIVNYRSSSTDSTGYKYLSFDLGGIEGEKVRIYINGTTGNAISFYEVRCFGEFISELENVFNGKTVTAVNSEAYTSYSFDKLTDSTSIYDVGGRYSSKVSTASVLDATVDLGGLHILNELKMYVFSDGSGTAADFIGNNLVVEAYINGVWTNVINLKTNAEVLAHLVSNADSTGYKYLSLDLNGALAEKVRIYINGAKRAISYHEFKCFGYAVSNSSILKNKEFTPTTEALNCVFPPYNSNVYFGYETLTDGSVVNDNKHRFSTNTSNSIVDATVQLDGIYLLDELRLFDYTDDNYATAAYAGTNLTVEAYTDGSWVTIGTYTNADLLASRVKLADGNGNSYLSISLKGVAAERLRIYIDGCVSGKSISFYEIECYGVFVG